MNITLEQLENLRKKIVKKQIIFIICTIAITIALVLVTKIIFMIPFPLIIGFIIGFIVTAKDQQKYTLWYKDYFVVKSLDKTFESVVYTPEKGLDEEIIANTYMMDMGDDYYSNDFIQAKYKNVFFTQADVHITREETDTDSDGNTTTHDVTIFMGKWMIFDFNKKFKANIQVADKWFGNNCLYRRKGEEKFKKVEMESEAFNKKFLVYTQLEHDAFYVLTPQMIDKIMNLSTICNGRLMFCFIDDKLHIAINSYKDSFEPKSMFKKLDENAVLADIQNEIKEITMFIDELSHNSDLFM